jgi:hypothetical protein
MASTSVHIKGSESVSKASREAAGGIENLKNSVKSFTQPANDLMKIGTMLLSGGGTIFALKKLYSGLADCEAAFIKMNPEMANAAGSAKQFDTSLTMLKSSIGGFISTAISPLRLAISSLVDEWSKAIAMRNEYNTLKSKADAGIALSVQEQAAKAKDEFMLYQKMLDDLAAQRKSRRPITDDMREQLEALRVEWLKLSREAASAKLVQEGAERSEKAASPWTQAITAFNESMYLINREMKAGIMEADAYHDQSQKLIRGLVEKGMELHLSDKAIAEYVKMIEPVTKAIKELKTPGGAGTAGERSSSIGTGLINSSINGTSSTGFKGMTIAEYLAGFGLTGGELGAPAKEEEAFDWTPYEHILNEFTGQIRSISILLDPVKVIIDGIAKVLAPLFDSTLAPIIGGLYTLGMTIGQIVAPLFQILAPIITAVASAFVWLYNNAILPVGNWLIDFFNSISNLFIAFSNAVSAVIKFVTFGLVDLGQMKYIKPGSGHLAPISLEGLTATGAAYMGQQGGGGYGSSTTVQHVPDIYVYQTFQGPIIGASGMAEVGKFTVEAIEEYLGTGARVEFLQN